MSHPNIEKLHYNYLVCEKRKEIMKYEVCGYEKAKFGNSRVRIKSDASCCHNCVNVQTNENR